MVHVYSFGIVYIGMPKCTRHVAYLANSSIGEAVVACVPLLGVQLEDQNGLCQTVDSVTHLAQLDAYV